MSSVNPIDTIKHAEESAKEIIATARAKAEKDIQAAKDKGEQELANLEQTITADRADRGDQTSAATEQLRAQETKKLESNIQSIQNIPADKRQAAVAQILSVIEEQN